MSDDTTSIDEPARQEQASVSSGPAHSREITAFPAPVGTSEDIPAPSTSAHAEDVSAFFVPAPSLEELALTGTAQSAEAGRGPSAIDSPFAPSPPFRAWLCAEGSIELACHECNGSGHLEHDLSASARKPVCMECNGKGFGTLPLRALPQREYNTVIVEAALPVYQSFPRMDRLGYPFSDCETELELFVPSARISTDPRGPACNLVVRFLPRHLSLSVADGVSPQRTILDERLWGKCDPEESTWMRTSVKAVDGILIIIVKRKEEWWPSPWEQVCTP